MAGRYVYISAREAARIAPLVEREELLSTFHHILLSIVDEAKRPEIIPSVTLNEVRCMTHRGEVSRWKPLHAFSEPEKDTHEDTGYKKL